MNAGDAAVCGDNVRTSNSSSDRIYLCNLLLGLIFEFVSIFISKSLLGLHLLYYVMPIVVKEWSKQLSPN